MPVLMSGRRPQKEDIIITDDPYEDIPMTPKKKKKIIKWYNKALTRRLKLKEFKGFHCRVKVKLK